MNISELSSTTDFPSLENPFQEERSPAIDFHSYAKPLDTVNPPPLSKKQIVCDFGKIIFAPENRLAILGISTLSFSLIGSHIATPLLMGKMVEMFSDPKAVVEIGGFAISKTCLLTIWVASYTFSQIAPNLSQQLCAQVQSNTLVSLLRKDMEYLLNRSLEFHVRTPIGEMFSLIQKSFSLPFLGMPLLTDILPTIAEIAIASIALTYQYGPVIGISLLGLSAAYSLFAAFAMQPALRASEEVNQAFNEGFETMGKLLCNYKTTRDCNQEEKSFETLQQILNTMRTKDIAAQSKMLQANLGGSVFSCIHLLFVLLYASTLPIYQASPGKHALLLIGYLNTLTSLFPSCAASLGRILSTYPDLHYVLSRIRMPSEITDPNPGVPLLLSGAPEITFENISFQYKEGETPLFRNLSFTIPAGKTTALVSKSGSGKTSLLNLLYGYYAPSSGTIKINGQDISKVSLHSVQEQICILGQNPNLFQGTLRDNILYGAPKAKRDEITDLELHAFANSLRLDGFFESFPEGLDMNVGEGGKSLSGGQQQKVSLLRGLLKNAPIQLLDEATASLDAISAGRILEKVLHPERPVTTIMISHKLHEAQKADIILLLDEGKILAKGTHEELLIDCPLYKNLWGAQQQESVNT